MARFDFIVLGIGISAFVFLYSLFNANLTTVLQKAEIRHNRTLLEIHDLFIDERKSHRECLENEEKDSLKLSELQGKLEGQHLLAQKYKVLLKEHQKTAQELSKLRVKLDLNQKQKKDLMELILENSETLEELRSDHMDYEATKRAIQQRHNVLCKEQYKIGPYYVQFKFLIHGQKRLSSFVVELSSRAQLPHSVFTFLSLVESNLFDGFKISASEDSLQIEPDEESAAKIVNNFKAFGYGESALSFLETSAMFPCVQNSIGFVGKGPKLRVVMSEDFGSDMFCFGKVVRGMKPLSLLRAELLKGSAGASVVEMKNLEL